MVLYLNIGEYLSYMSDDNGIPPQPQKKLQPILPQTKTWKHIGMDLICDLCESEDSYKHVLVSVCYVSKYVVVRPLKTKTSEEVIKNLKDVYLDMGLPDIIQHDQGKEFTSNVICCMWSKYTVQPW